jgi:hypothetical protein
MQCLDDVSDAFSISLLSPYGPNVTVGRSPGPHAGRDDHLNLQVGRPEPRARGGPASELLSDCRDSPGVRAASLAGT